MLDPSPFSCETFCARLRDSIKAYLNNLSWQSDISRLRLAEIRADCIITNNGKEVYIGPKLAKPENFHFTRKAVDVKETVLDSPTNDIVAAYLTLLQNSLLVGQIRITGTYDRPHLDHLLNKSPNVEALEQGNDIILL